MAADVRRRWQGLVVLGLLVGVAGGLSMAAISGARRTDTAYPRFLEETLAADAVVYASQEGLYNPDFEPIRQLPYVTASGAFSIAFVPEPVCLFAASDDWRTRVDRPLLLEGRLPDPTQPTEVLVASGDLAPPGASARVGDTITVTLPPSEGGLEGAMSADGGTAVELQVVGIGKSSFEIATLPGTTGCLVAGPALLDSYDLHGQVFHNLMVRLANGKADVARLEQDVARLLGTPVPIQDLSGNTKRVTNGTDLERSGLYLFGAAVAVAALLIVGQALTRSVRSGGTDVDVLRAIGLDRLGLVVSLSLPYAVTGAAALVAGVGAAAALSPRFPIGLARSVEPDPGVQVDARVIGLGSVVLALFVVGVVVAAAAATSRRVGVGRVRGGSRVFSIVAGLGAPVAASLGAGLALESGRGRRALPSRPALLAAVVGVLGVVGAFTLGTGIDDAIRHKERFGTVWDVELIDYSGQNGPPYEAAVRALQEDRSVTAVASITKQNLSFGERVVPVFAVEASRGQVAFTVLTGRPPEHPREVVLGPATAASEGLDIGDTVALGPRGDLFEVVGRGLLPETPHSQFDQGAWIVAGNAVFAEPPDPRVTEYTVGVLRSDHDLNGVLDRVASAGGPELEVRPPEPSADQQNLKGVRPLPALFAVFTILLALGALGHVTVSVLRRRRGELAVLRAIGVTPGQTWRCLLWQASYLGAVGVALGIPLGASVGRSAWQSVADATPMVYVAPVAVVVLAVTAPVALVLANLVAMGPGWRASRLRPAEVLRAE